MKNTNHSVLKHLHFWMIAVTALAAYNPKTNGSIINNPMANVPMTGTPTNNVQVSESRNSRLTHSMGTSPQPPHEAQADRPAIASLEKASEDPGTEQSGQLFEDEGILASPTTKQRVPGTSTSQTTKERNADRLAIVSTETAPEDPDAEQSGQLFEDEGTSASPTTKQRALGTSTPKTTKERNADQSTLRNEEQLGTSTLALGHTQHPGIRISTSEDKERPCPNTSPGPTMWTPHGEGHPSLDIGTPGVEEQSGRGIRVPEMEGQPGLGISTPAGEERPGLSIWTPDGENQPSLYIETTGGDYQSTLGIRTSTEVDHGVWIKDDEGNPRPTIVASATEGQQSLGTQTPREINRGVWIKDDEGNPRPEIVASATEGQQSLGTQTPREINRGMWIKDYEGNPRPKIGAPAKEDEAGLGIQTTTEGYQPERGVRTPSRESQSDQGTWTPATESQPSLEIQTSTEEDDGLWIIDGDGDPQQLGLDYQAPPSENDPGEEGPDMTYLLEKQPFKWIRHFFRDFNSQILALNLRMCATTCTFSFEELSGIYAQHCSACSCDRHCHVYGDCCPDLQIPHSFTDVTDSSLGEGVRAPNRDNISTCQSTYIKVASLRDFRSMVNYCPSSFQPSNRTSAVTTEPPGLSSSARGHLKAKCENWANSSHWRYQRPVHTSDGVVYRNKFCAQCHGERAEDLTPWTTRVECASNQLDSMTSATDLYDSAVNSPTCDIHFYKDGFPRRPCTPVFLPVISSCNQTGLWLAYDDQIKRACASFYSVVIKKYKNLFCFLCNTNHTYISALMYLRFWSDKIANPARESFFALLDINDDDGSSADDVTSSLKRKGGNMSDVLVPCEKGMVRDPIQCECRAVQCGTGLVPQRNKCIEMFAATNFHGLNMCYHFHFHADKPVNATFLEMIMRIMTDRLSVSTFRVEQQTAVTGVPRFGCDKTFLTLDVHVSTFNPRATRLADTARALRLFTQDVATTLSTTTPHNVTATGPVQHCWQQSDLKRVEDYCFPEGQNLPLMTAAPYDTSHVTYQTLYNTTLCPHVNLNVSEFQDYRNHLQRLGLSEENVTHDVLTENGETFYLLCVDDWLKIVTEDTCTPAKVKVSSAGGFEDTWTPVGLTSIVCTCVSLMSLLCVMVTFTAVPPLRAGPGLSTLAMACVLFLAQALHEVGLEQYEAPQLCLVLALLIHFLWLAAVFMMSSCTLQLFAAIVFPLKYRLLVQSSGRKLLAASLAFSLGCSAVLVALTALGNHLMYDDLGYPADHVCFIKRSMSKYLGFGLPLGVAVVCNVVLFIIAVVHLRTRPSISSTREHRVSLVACFRLSMITGACWVTLFVLPLPGTRPWLEYVAVVLLGLQGLLLAATLLLNKRVWYLCTERWAARAAPSANTTTSACS